MQKPLLLIFRGILPGRIQARDLFILDNFHPTKIFVCCGVQFSMIFCRLSKQISIFAGLINLTFLVISVIVISKFSPTMGTIYNDFWSFVTQVSVSFISNSYESGNIFMSCWDQYFAQGPRCVYYSSVCNTSQNCLIFVQPLIVLTWFFLETLRNLFYQYLSQTAKFCILPNN